jgi:hypothetical protein
MDLVTVIADLAQKHAVLSLYLQVRADETQ